MNRVQDELVRVRKYIHILDTGSDLEILDVSTYLLSSALEKICAEVERLQKREEVLLDVISNASDQLAEALVLKG